MWNAFYRADGEMQHQVTDEPVKYAHMAEQKLRDFLARIPHPDVQIWWAWIENEDETITWEEILAGENNEL